MSNTNSNNLTIFFVSLGCDKNLVDSEVMLGILREHGFTLVDDEMEADVIVVNTCSFIHDAKEESIQTILEMAEMKHSCRCKALIVTGCMAERYKDEIMTEIEEVDAVIGTTSYQHIAEVVAEVLDGRKVEQFNDLQAMPEVDVQRIMTTGGYSSYLKIAEGCDKHCTYCIIPKLRGSYRSHSMDYLIRQAEITGSPGCERAEYRCPGDNSLRHRTFTTDRNCFLSCSEDSAVSKAFPGSVFCTVTLKRSMKSLFRSSKKNRRSAIILIFPSSMAVTPS